MLAPFFLVAQGPIGFFAGKAFFTKETHAREYAGIFGIDFIAVVFVWSLWDSSTSDVKKRNLAAHMATYQIKLTLWL